MMKLTVFPTMQPNQHSGDYRPPPLDRSPCRVLVRRAMLLRGERQEPGTVLKLERWEAEQVVAAGRAEFK